MSSPDHTTRRLRVQGWRLKSEVRSPTMRDLMTGAVVWEKDLIMSNGGSPLAADADGNIYVVPFQNGVTKYDPAGNVFPFFNAISNLASDLDVDASGNIYIVGSTVSSKS